METNPAENTLAEEKPEENKLEESKPEETVDSELPESDSADSESLSEEERCAKSLLYRFRGLILGIFAVGMMTIPPADLEIVPFLVFVNLLIIAVYLRVKTRRVIGEHARGKVRTAEKLITWGAYARVRHPLYVSNMAIAVGCIFLHLGVDWKVVPFAVAVILFEFLLSKQEDHFLEDKFGDEWRVWAMHTPAFFPREYHLSGPMRSAREAIVSDTSTWFWLAVCIALILFRKVDFLLWA